MPTIDTTSIHGVDRHTQVEGTAIKGHVSNTVYGRGGQTVFAALDDTGQIAVNISGVGGSTTLLFDTATWDQIIAHVTAVREQVTA